MTVNRIAKQKDTPIQTMNPRCMTDIEPFGEIYLKPTP